MKWGKMLAAGVLLAGLAAVVWWSNRQEKAKEGKPAADAPPKILALAADTIQQIEIRHRGEDPITLKLNGSQWEMTSPKLTVDSSAVSAITSAAASVDAERVVDPNISDLTAYGLAPASIEVDFSTKVGGSGLGLAIVSKIIEDHGGIIQAYGNETKGLSFKIDLPYKTTHKDANV